MRSSDGSTLAGKGNFKLRFCTYGACIAMHADTILLLSLKKRR
jgi:hypothetical protein